MSNAKVFLGLDKEFLVGEYEYTEALKKSDDIAKQLEISSKATSVYFRDDMVMEVDCINRPDSYKISFSSDLKSLCGRRVRAARGRILVDVICVHE